MFPVATPTHITHDPGQNRVETMNKLLLAAALTLVPGAALADEWWVPTKSDGCVLADSRMSGGDAKGPADFILTLKYLGRDYSTDDERDASGRVVGTVVHDEATGGGMAFYRTRERCAAVVEEYLSNQQKARDAIKDKYP
jgi:hypothetical protein